MKFQLQHLEGRNRFTGYGQGYVEVNGERIVSNVVVAGERVDLQSLSDGLSGLSPTSMEAVADGRPEVVLIGTGSVFRFPPRHLLSPLQGAGIGVEVMDTPAACRTFNILLAEGRNVVAALVVD